MTERRILERIDRWVRAGGTLIYPTQPRGLLETVEGDQSISQRWRQGETGKGKVIFYPGDPVPGEHYARFVRNELRRLGSLRPQIRRALEIDKPEFVYWSVLENGRLALLNFEDAGAVIRLADGGKVRLPPYRMALVGE